MSTVFPEQSVDYLKLYAAARHILSRYGNHTHQVAQKLHIIGSHNV